MAKKRSKQRAEFRKNRAPRTRDSTWTRGFRTHGFEQVDTIGAERVSGKGELTRKRTVRLDEAPADDSTAPLQVDESLCRKGRVLSVHGVASVVEGEGGVLTRCATRRLLKTLSTDQRHVVAAGDVVWFRPVGVDEGIIERVEPRHGTLSRASRGRRHILVTNVDQLLIIASVAEPYLKPNLIDRFLVTAEKAAIRPLICLTKIDLIDPATIQPLIGVYSQMGYRTLALSIRDGRGIDRLRRELFGKESAVAGQSGVGKSSLLNAVEPGLALRVAEVSAENQKGRHTTTTARLLPLSRGGYVIDTPGIRQFELWDVIPEEVGGYFRDIRPFVSHCGFPDCTHTHEYDCAVKHAVADGWLDLRRYESYCNLFHGDPD